ncbi:MAG: hypothetical protein AB7I19_11455 [Planctomycetota bacterium]
MNAAESSGHLGVELADLFEPVVTKDLDLAAFDRPYRPISLTLVVFFTGALLGGVLMATNWRRLGRPRAVLPTAAAFLLVFLATHVAFLWFAPDLRGKPELRSFLRFALQVVAVAPALAILGAQAKRYDIWERSSGEERSAFRIGSVFFLLNIALAVGITYLAKR